MRIKDIVERGLIMPQTIKPMGLIHLPGTGPNNRFDFKNKGNNRANEARGSCWHGYQQTEEWEEFLENFADKKVKGKSRPGRVKRAGASCKGSVSSLRAKAKKYSGERGKMYHWCANMKSGRKKKK